MKVTYAPREDVAALSPYLTSHIKRFGDYLVDLEAIPQALEGVSLVLDNLSALSN